MQIFHFEDIKVDMARGCVTQGGREIHLRQKAFRVLVHLVESRERLVTKEELFDVIWKNTAVTDDVLVQCVKEIRRAIGDDPHDPRFIKTVPKVGYRFIADVEGGANGRSYSEEITRVEFEYEEDDGLAVERPVPRLALPARPVGSGWRRYALTGVAAVLLVTGAALYFQLLTASKTAEPRLPQIAGRKTVAVMFFENQSGDAELDWLREGLADMLITDLSRSEKLTVLGREQLGTLLDRAGHARGASVSLEDAAAIVHKSGAETIIIGSFARLGDKMRLDAKVYDSATGDLQTAETLTVDRPEQILSEIDLLSLRLINQLSTGGGERPYLADVMTNNLEAYRYYSLGVEKANSYSNAEAIEFFERAVALDPDFAMAHARIGYAYGVSGTQNEKAKPYLEKAFKMSSRLTEKDRMSIAAWYALVNLDYEAAMAAYRGLIARYPLEAEAYWRLGRVLAAEGRSDEAAEILRQGIAIDPGYGNLFNQLGFILSRRGEHGSAIAAHQRFVELEPNNPNTYDSLGLSYQWSGDYQKAIENYERAIALRPNFGVALIHLANTRIRSGQYAAAIEVLQRYFAVAASPAEKARGHNTLAFIYLRKGDLNAAERAGKQAIKELPGPNWNLYLIAISRGQTALANRLGDEFLADPRIDAAGARPEGRFHAYYKGTIAQNSGTIDEGIEHFREALKHPPVVWNYDDFEDALGRALVAAGRYDEAIAEFDRILRLNPNYPLAHFHLARAYEAKGIGEQAHAHYTAFLQSWPDADPDLHEVVAARKAVGN